MGFSRKVMRSLAFRVLALGAVIFGVENQDYFSPVTEISGPINAAFIDKLHTVSPYSHISVRSGGGDPDFGDQAAAIIEAKGLSVVISGGCLSSCAEYILPAAKTLHFQRGAVIGFHQNPKMIDHIYRMNSNGRDRVCHYADNIQPLEALHQRRLGRSDFWQTVLQKLELSKTQISSTEACAVVGFKFKHEFWMPTSQQLRQDYGLRFKGSVCADKMRCAMKLRTAYRKNGLSVIVG